MIVDPYEDYDISKMLVRALGILAVWVAFHVAIVVAGFFIIVNTSNAVFTAADLVFWVTAALFFPLRYLVLKYRLVPFFSNKAMNIRRWLYLAASYPILWCAAHGMAALVD